MASYRAAILERHQRAQKTRRAAMTADAERLARTLSERFPIRRLYLFGSVADGRPLSVWSDIDLAVEGLPPDRFLELAGAVARLRAERRARHTPEPGPGARVHRL